MKNNSPLQSSSSAPFRQSTKPSHLNW